MMDLRHLIGQASQLHQAGRHAEAEPLYIRALNLFPGNYPALHLLGLLRLQQNRVGEAISLMERALNVQPNVPETLANYGMALKAAGRLDEALSVLNKEVALRPNHARSWNNRGTVLIKLGRTEAALADFDRAAALDGSNIEIIINRALALQTLRRYRDAVAAFTQVLAQRPGDLNAWSNRGICWREANHPAAALADFDRALTLAPDNQGVLLNRAGTLTLLGREDEARACYDALLAAQPELTAGRLARAGLLERRGLLRPAIADLEEANRQQPELPYLLGRLMHLKMAAGDWDDEYNRGKAELDEAIRSGRRATEPFVYHALSNSLADLQACCRLFSADRYPVQPPIAARRDRRAGPIRVGYVAGEFHNHATLLLSIGLFEHHDRSRFEVFAFDNGVSDGSELRSRFEAAVSGIIPIADLNDRDAAERIREADIDILVNLNGHVGLQRTNVFAQRPSPVQVNYLGFPGTMGAPYIDYILADRQLIEEGEQKYYDEKVVWLPNSYQINDDKRGPVDSARRAEYGLPEESFVFCMFNSAYKITPSMFAVWMRLMSQVEDSVLWMLDENDQFADNMRRAAAGHGVDPRRLIFAPKATQPVHVARLALADLFLDTTPCTAHTMASEVLWVGLPLVTLRGGTFAGRVASSLLMAAGAPDLITDNLDGYENLVLALARDPARLKAIRDRLVAMRDTCALFDTAATTRNIENAYAIMLERWLAGELPQSFAVSESACSGGTGVGRTSG
ncbi:MAG: tetratricopeptide repeat protein [Pseudomonadota bacterium]